ncbi:CDGSH iron-sulfur domain-containing protein [Streptomyces sp. NPDC097704]|uniref:CDGSH iron-sulfur domain-containing protein n=1 Tax=Streptomyces sp. NPDC097704 TaxID=3157101 RepID=UPI0033271224
MSASPNEDTPQVRPAEDDGAGGPGPRRARSDPPRIRPLPEGPLPVEGPAEIVMPDGTVIRCERPVMALCTCRGSLRAPPLPPCDRGGEDLMALFPTAPATKPETPEARGDDGADGAPGSG